LFGFVCLFSLSVCLFFFSQCFVARMLPAIYLASGKASKH